jgi:hypothetical protein
MLNECLQFLGFDTIINVENMNMIEYANIETETVLNIRKLVEDALKRNPGMSSGAVLDLMMEQIQEDVLDGWDPDADQA